MRLELRNYAGSRRRARAHAAGGIRAAWRAAWTLTPSAAPTPSRPPTSISTRCTTSDFGPPFPPGFVFGAAARHDAPTSACRLSARWRSALKIEKQVGKDTSVDVKLERYGSAAKWRLFGSGSPGLQDFRRAAIQVGMTTRW